MQLCKLTYGINFSEGDYVLVERGKILWRCSFYMCTCLFSSISATHLDILRFSLTIHPMNFECWSVVFCGSVFL